jgi:hypothetical protein
VLPYFFFNALTARYKVYSIYIKRRAHNSLGERMGVSSLLTRPDATRENCITCPSTGSAAVQVRRIYASHFRKSKFSVSTEQDQFETRRTDFEARDHGASRSRSVRLSFARREVPLSSKNRKICRNISIFTINTFNMQRELWEIFFSTKIPIFLNLAKGKQERMESR